MNTTHDDAKHPKSSTMQDRALSQLSYFGDCLASSFAMQHCCRFGSVSAASSLPTGWFRRGWIPLRLVLAGQGTHTAMKSGMLAAEAAFDALTAAAPSAAPADLAPYEAALRSSWVWEELERERNIRPACAAP